MPKFDYICNTKASVYSYPPAFEEKKEELDKVETAVLSITGKKKAANAKRRERETKILAKDSLIPASLVSKLSETYDDAMDTSTPPTTSDKEKSDKSTLEVEKYYFNIFKFKKFIFLE